MERIIEMDLVNDDNSTEHDNDNGSIEESSSDDSMEHHNRDGNMDDRSNDDSSEHDNRDESNEESSSDDSSSEHSSVDGYEIEDSDDSVISTDGSSIDIRPLTRDDVASCGDLFDKLLNVCTVCHHSSQYQYITDEGAILIAAALRKNTKVKVINFSGLLFSSNGFTILMESIMVSTSLQKFGLTGCSAGDVFPFESEQIRILSEALQENSVHFTRLEVSNYNIGVNGVKILLNSLLVNTVIEYVDMSITIKCSVETEYLESVADEDSSPTMDNVPDTYLESIIQIGEIFTNILHCNKSLQYLNLSSNHICDEFIVLFADALQANTTLVKLYLEDNQISEVGIIALASALKVNNKLEDLLLTGNRILKAGMEAMADAMKVNKKLRKLQLCNDKDELGISWSHDSNAYVHDIDFGYMFKALEYNSTLQKIDLFVDLEFEEYMPPETIQSIIDSFEYNDTIISFINGCDYAPTSIQRIIKRNAKGERIAPKKGLHERRAVHYWLLQNPNLHTTNLF